MREHQNFDMRRQTLERREQRLGLPTEGMLVDFIKEHDGQDGFVGLKEKWENEREAGARPYFETLCVNIDGAADPEALERARSFVAYLNERVALPDFERQENKHLAEKAEAIKKYQVDLVEGSDRELAREFNTEFSGDIKNLIIDNIAEPLLRRMEKFIVDIASRLNEIGVIDKHEKKKNVRATALWHLLLQARSVRDELLRRHFEQKEN